MIEMMRPMLTRWGFWIVAVLLLASIGNVIGCSSEQPTQPVDAAETEPSSPETAAAPSPTESEAKVYAKTVKVTLDATTLEQLTAQMPDDMNPEATRDGENRQFVWTFDDGSQMIAVFRPAGGEGSAQGLVLYMVDIKD